MDCSSINNRQSAISNLLDSQCYTRAQTLPENGLPSRLFRASRRDARHAAVLRCEAAVPRRDRVFSHGGFLRDVLRGRADGGACARADADVALEGLERWRDSDVWRPAS